MSYTNDQQKVIDSIIKSKKSFLLKTYTIKYFKDEEALYLTPTNQAEEILQNQGIYNVFT